MFDLLLDLQQQSKFSKYKQKIEELLNVVNKQQGSLFQAIEDTKKGTIFDVNNLIRNINVTIITWKELLNEIPGKEDKEISMPQIVLPK